MVESLKEAASDCKTKSSLQDEEIRRDFFSSWISLSVAEDDALDSNSPSLSMGSEVKKSNLKIDKLKLDTGSTGDSNTVDSARGDIVKDAAVASVYQDTLLSKHHMKEDRSVSKHSMSKHLLQPLHSDPEVHKHVQVKEKGAAHIHLKPLGKSDGTGDQGNAAVAPPVSINPTSKIAHPLGLPKYGLSSRSLKRKEKVTSIIALPLDAGIVLVSESLVTRGEKDRVCKRRGSEVEFNKILKGSYWTMAYCGTALNCVKLYEEMEKTARRYKNAAVTSVSQDTLLSKHHMKEDRSVSKHSKHLLPPLHSDPEVHKNAQVKEKGAAHIHLKPLGKSDGTGDQGNAAVAPPVSINPTSKIAHPLGLPKYGLSSRSLKRKEQGTSIIALPLDAGIVLVSESRVTRGEKDIVCKRRGSEVKCNKILKGSYWTMEYCGTALFCAKLYEDMEKSARRYKNARLLCKDFENTIIKLSEALPEHIREDLSCGVIIVMYEYNNGIAVPKVIEIEYFFEDNRHQLSKAVHGTFAYDGSYYHDLPQFLKDHYDYQMTAPNAVCLGKNCVSIAAMAARRAGSSTVGGWYSVAVVTPATPEERKRNIMCHCTITREERVIPKEKEYFEKKSKYPGPGNEQVGPGSIQHLFDGADDFWNQFD